MFKAKAVARTLGKLTFASAVLDGPLLKNIQNTAIKMQIHAGGKREHDADAGNKKIRAREFFPKPITSPTAEQRRKQTSDGDNCAKSDVDVAEQIRVGGEFCTAIGIN